MSLNVVFMGTPDFAVPCLKRLLEEGHRVKGVFSQPDRPKGRGMHLQPPPVKVLAQEHGLPVFQPSTLRDGSALAQLKELNPDVIVVVAYGRILPPDILKLPPLGCINVHASLLPRLRGAAPIQWSIIRGEKVTGVTTMYMAEGLDTGDMIFKEETPIGPEETAGELFERLAPMGAELLIKTLKAVEKGTAPRIPQDDALATLAPPLKKEDARLDFSASPADFCNRVRGCNPSPGAFALCEDGSPLKVHRAIPVPDRKGEPGVLLDKKRLIVGCGNGAVELLTVQPQGKKAMEGSAFLNGLRGAPLRLL